MIKNIEYLINADHPNRVCIFYNILYPADIMLLLEKKFPNCTSKLRDFSIERDNTRIELVSLRAGNLEQLICGKQFSHVFLPYNGFTMKEYIYIQTKLRLYPCRTFLYEMENICGD